MGGITEAIGSGVSSIGSGLFKAVGQNNTIVVHPSVRYNKEFSLNFIN